LDTEQTDVIFDSYDKPIADLGTQNN